VVFGTTASRNTLSGNLIYNNGGLAIDLDNDSVSENDDGDIDSGPNEMLNFAVIDSVNMNPDSSFTIFWSLGFQQHNQFFVAHVVGEDDMPSDLPGMEEAYQYAGLALRNRRDFRLSGTEYLSAIYAVSYLTMTPLEIRQSSVRIYFLSPPRL